MIALLQRCDARADIDDDSGALMAEDCREDAFRVGPRQGELVGVQMPVALISTSTSLRAGLRDQLP